MTAQHLLPQVDCDISPTDKVYAHIKINYPLSPSDLWQEIKNLERFLCIDPFHSRIIIMEKNISKGTDLALEHQILGWRFLRFGKIVSWQEGTGYAFSDISAKGAKQGFPHVFFVQIFPWFDDKGNRSQLSITIKGKWTTKWVPLLLRHWWIKRICSEHACLLMKGIPV